MIITIKSLPESKNKYGNWCYHKKARYRKEVEKEIFYEGIKQRAKAPGKPFERARLSFLLYFRTKQRKDAQNYTAGGLIAYTDSLVSLGYIKDDNYNVVGQPQVWVGQCKENPRTEIRIEDVRIDYVSEFLLVGFPKSDIPTLLKKELNATEILKYGLDEYSFRWKVLYIKADE